MKLLFSLFFSTLLFLGFSQVQQVPDGYFRSPVDVKIYLSGTFGEPRTTHFHTGIDIKTQGVEGKAIYTVADGYVSRIAVSPYGYGNALYITHPNGLVSVYGHLQKFKSEIQEWVKQQQHNQTSFAINIENMDSSLFVYKKGEVVAMSGNSGGSGGPHLHFEIRDSLEHPLNPLLYGYDEMIIDQARPNIYNLFVYNLTSDKAFTSSKKIKANLGSSGSYTISNTVVVNSDEIGFGIHTIDLFTGTSNKNGVYEIKMFDDDQLYYHYQIDELSFDVTKHVYSHCDYWAKRNNNNTVHKCFVEQGNKLEVYPYLQNQGKLILSDGESHSIRIEVSDFHGNTSKLNFKVRKSMTNPFFKISPFAYNDYFIYGERNEFKNSTIQLDFPPEVLFEDAYFKFQEVEKGSFSNSYQIHDSKTPLSGYFDIHIALKNIDSTLVDKYLISYLDYKNRKKSIGGKVRNGFIQSKSREFGFYTVNIDTIPPKITAVNISENKSMTYQKLIQFKAADNLAGIEEYNAFVNGKWVVLEFDAKRAKFTYVIDENTVKGSNEIEVVISDGRNNASVVKYVFTY